MKSIDFIFASMQWKKIQFHSSDDYDDDDEYSIGFNIIVNNMLAFTHFESSRTSTNHAHTICYKHWQLGVISIRRKDLTFNCLTVFLRPKTTISEMH